MKKAFVLFLALVLALFVFAACKDNSEPTETATSEPTTTEPDVSTTKIMEDGIDEKDQGWSWSWY